MLGHQYFTAPLTLFRHYFIGKKRLWETRVQHESQCREQPGSDSSCHAMLASGH